VGRLAPPRSPSVVAAAVVAAAAAAAAATAAAVAVSLTRNGASSFPCLFPPCSLADMLPCVSVPPARVRTDTLLPPRAATLPLAARCGGGPWFFIATHHEHTPRPPRHPCHTAHAACVPVVCPVMAGARRLPYRYGTPSRPRLFHVFPHARPSLPCSCACVCAATPACVLHGAPFLITHACSVGAQSTWWPPLVALPPSSPPFLLLLQVPLQSPPSNELSCGV